MSCWAQAEFEGARVPDGRHRRTLARMSESLAAASGESYSGKLSHAGRQAARRVLRNEETEVDGLLWGHYEQTALRCSEHEVVLALQDTTTFDYGTHLATEGLGPINSERDSYGVVGHGVLMVARSGEPLGLVDVSLWSRRKEEYGKRRTRHERRFEDKESVKWAKGLDALRERLCREQRVVAVCDREGDIFELFAWPRREGVELLVRASYPRKALVEDGDRKVNLLEAASSAPVVGGMVVRVPRKPGQKERMARLEVRCGPVWVLAPGRDKTEPVAMSVVRAKEMEPPSGVSGIEWVLVTTCDVSGEAEAVRCVQDYARRWCIERLHYTLKSGLKVERLQIDEGEALMKALAVHYVVAWRLQWMTHAARVSPELPAEQFVTADELVVLERHYGRGLRTASEVLVAIARLGGYEWYKNAPAPGVKFLWLGLRRLTDMTAGYLLALSLTRDVNQD